MKAGCARFRAAGQMPRPARADAVTAARWRLTATARCARGANRGRGREGTGRGSHPRAGAARGGGGDGEERRRRAEHVAAGAAGGGVARPGEGVMA